MPTELGPAFMPSWGGYPPGMSRDDYVLWQKYKPQIAGTPIAMYFNVYLGSGPEESPEILPPMKDFWRRKNQLRADVILQYDDHVRIIELRSNAGTGTLGRIQAYGMLLNMDNPFGTPVELEVVTNRETPDLRMIAQRQNIILTILP